MQSEERMAVLEKAIERAQELRLSVFELQDESGMFPDTVWDVLEERLTGICSQLEASRPFAR